MKNRIKLNFIIGILFSSTMLSACSIMTLKPEEIRQKRGLIKDGSVIDKKQAVIIAQACLLDSPYSNDYDYRKYEAHYDKAEPPFTGLWFEKYGHPAWFIGFMSKTKSDECMYGAVIFKDGKDNSCGCMIGI
jgi:hypothetical protein